MTVRAPDESIAIPPATGITRRGLITAGLGVTGAVGIAGTGTLAYAATEAATQLAITDYALTPPGWPAGHKLTIAVVADIHAGGPNMGIERVRQIVDSTNRLGCDLTVLLGDYFATHRFITEPVTPPQWAAELARLRAPLGVYSILGNHDWWHNIEGARGALQNVRIPVMENDAVLLGPSGRQFWLAGLGDQLAYRLGRSRFRGVDDLPGTLKKITTNDPVILLAHEPDIFVEVPARVSLTLSGHTHGGQIRVPFVAPFWAPSEFGARFAYGHIVENDRHLIVSGGLGTSIVPLRLGMPPEILRVTLGA